jgi:hypothetical protein
MKTGDLLYIITFLEFVAGIIAAIYYRKYKNSTEKYFLYLIWITFLLEAVGGLLKTAYPAHVNSMFVVFTFASFLFYFYWYYTILEGKIVKNTAIFFALAFVLVSLYSYTVAGARGFAFVTGAVCILILTVVHFYQLLNSNEVLIIKYKLSFWISTGLLLFYVGIIPLVLLAKPLVIKPLSYKIVLVSLNCILYGCYIVGFIWTKKKYNRF